MAPVGVPDREIDVPLPACCPDCGGEVEHERTAEQFQVELPEMRPVTTKFTVGVGRCRNCGRRVQARHAEQTSDALGAASSQVGPTAKAWAAWLHYGLGLSFVKSASLLARLGVNVSAGALCQAAQSTSTDLVPVQASIVAAVNNSAMIVPDETGWRVGGKGTWLWVAATRGATAYWVADGRGFEQACEVISPEFSGVMVRDGWAPYRRFDSATHQTCLAHLLRRCDELIADLPIWARDTPRKVREILTEALIARDLGDGEQMAVIRRSGRTSRDARRRRSSAQREPKARGAPVRGTRCPLQLPHPPGNRRHQLESRASRPPGGREPQGMGRQQDLAWSCDPGPHDERAADRISAGSRRHRLLEPTRPCAHAGGRSFAIHLNRRLFGSTFTELRKVAAR
jgi:hypothetical protein